MQCEGYRRRGGAFTLGPVDWVQCENAAITMLTLEQEEISVKPACELCWNECVERGIKILKAEHIANAPKAGE